MHETQQPRDPKKTTGIVYAVILVVLLLLNFWAFPAMMKGQVKQVDYGTFLNMLEGGELSTVEIQDQQIYFVDKNDTTYCTNSIAQEPAAGQPVGKRRRFLWQGVQPDHLGGYPAGLGHLAAAHDHPDRLVQPHDAQAGR